MDPIYFCGSPWHARFQFNKYFDGSRIMYMVCHGMPGFQVPRGYNVSPGIFVAHCGIPGVGLFNIRVSPYIVVCRHGMHGFQFTKYVVQPPII